MGQYADFFGLNSTDLTWVVEDNCAGTFCFADLGTPYNLSVRLRWFFFFFFPIEVLLGSESEGSRTD